MPNPMAAQAPAQISYASPDMPVLHRAIIQTLERLTGKGQLSRRYQEYRTEGAGRVGPYAWDLALDKLGVTLSYSDQNLQKRPSKGLLMIANHPFGVVDGIILSWLASRLDPDFKVISIDALLAEPTLAKNLLPIDFSGTPEAGRANVQTKRAAIETLKQGGVVGIFPAGGVSRLHKYGQPVRDDTWKPLTGKLIRASGCDVLPIRFHGRNSRAFQLASRHSQVLRYALYLNEARNKLDKPLSLEIGKRLSNEALPDLDPEQLTRYLRKITGV